MKKISILLSAMVIVTIVLTMSSCSSKLGALSADNFNVIPNPLEANGGKVAVTINGSFPEKYMKKKAVVTVVPVLRYNGGETKGEGATFQGEKVIGNDQTISYKVGGNYTMKTSFDYIDAMEQSELYLTFDAKVGKKSVTVPEVKVAYGVLATAELVNKTLKGTNAVLAEDAYQHVIKQKQEANIKFLIQQAKIRNSELKSVSINQFLATIRDIQKDEERKALENVEVSAYASPDGGLNLNTNLAKNREKVTKDYVDKMMKKTGLDGNVDAKYTAEDWEGFQELVAQSNIQDKEVILRVLSMYQDPEERETQIKNISAAFTDLAKEILPQLRRARITVNYELIGRSDEEILSQFKEDASKLSVEELLYAATLTDKCNEQKDIYTKTTQIYPNDYRAFNNLAMLAYGEGKYDVAKSYLEKAVKIDDKATEANINKGYLALIDGDVEAAKVLIAKGSANSNAAEALGNLYLKQGDIAQAVKSFGETKSNSAALAQLLAKDYMTAAGTLNSVAKPDAMTNYLKAIIAARTNNNTLVIENLKEAFNQDSSLIEYAAKDLEFAKLASDAAFKLLMK
ncbi:MAG: hypothetical protein KBT27_00595 [Prevotellaceae bacterium]|nr:hypothetical protein [Candidatus Faecinaster equi]